MEMDREIELTSNPVYSRIEFNDGLSKTTNIYDKDNNLVCEYTQILKFTDELSEDDLCCAQESLHNAQREFISTLMKTN